MNEASVKTFHNHDFKPIRERLYDLFVDNPTIVFTALDIEVKTGLTKIQIAKRLSEISREGLIKIIGVRECGKRTYSVYVLSDRDEIEKLKERQHVDDFNNWIEEGKKYLDVMPDDLRFPMKNILIWV